MDTPEQLTERNKAWNLGNTTVREAQRLRAGLSVLAGSPLEGNLEGRERERALAILLGEAEILRIQRGPEEDFSDLGRKWRAAMMQLGFIRTDSERLAENGVTGVAPYSITENGRRLIAATSLPAQQECFLRALLALQLPSPVEKFLPVPAFSPLRVFLGVLRELERMWTDAAISKTEMAAVVELLTSESAIPTAVERIIHYRDELAKAKGQERNKLETQFLESANASQIPRTLEDYADSNFRYLRLTGLFKQEKNRLGIAPHRRTLVEAILASPFLPKDGLDYLEHLWNGSGIPTDDREIAIAEAREAVRALTVAGVKASLPSDIEQRSVADVLQILHNLEQQLVQTRERAYASAQRGQWENIIEYLNGLISSGRPVPAKEAPAYFEWAIWRAFLAIDSLVNEPWECRKFEVYEGQEPFESFLPTGCAKGGGPDLVFEFEHFALVVEVTLTASSRQEAAEGEPVRRHVAMFADSYAHQSKPVYGLFLSLSVDTNTAETFRLAKWYRKDDSELSLKIVPLTLQQFANLFTAPLAAKGALNPQLLEDLLRDCLAEINSPAPAWKASITQRVDRFVTGRLSSLA
jgi:hypothetical protein